MREASPVEAHRGRECVSGYVWDETAKRIPESIAPQGDNSFRRVRNESLNVHSSERKIMMQPLRGGRVVGQSPSV